MHIDSDEANAAEISSDADGVLVNAGALGVEAEIESKHINTA